MSVWLTVCVLLGQAPTTWISVPEVGPDLVPQAPAFAPGLPTPKMDDQGVFLPHPLDAATSELIGYCTENYPAVCAAAIQAARDVERASCKGQLEIMRAQQRLEKIDEFIPHPVWIYYVVAAGSVAIGGTLGYVFGQLAAK